MSDGDRKLLAGMSGLVATFGAVNGLGYYVAGDGPGYHSAQGGGSFFFMVSLLASPLGAVLGVWSFESLAKLRRRRKRSNGG